MPASRQRRLNKRLKIQLSLTRHESYTIKFRAINYTAKFQLPLTRYKNYIEFGSREFLFNYSILTFEFSQ